MPLLSGEPFRGLVIGGVLLLAACSGKGMWHREGINTTELKRDQAACVGEAGDYDFLAFDTAPGRSLGGGANPARARIASRTNADVYRTCMQSKGYSKGPSTGE